jgi:hypothetical protein
MYSQVANQKKNLIIDYIAVKVGRGYCEVHENSMRKWLPWEFCDRKE